MPLASLSDAELLDGLRSGSELHFNELYHRYFQRIYSFVYARMRNHADAEEVVQETFTAVFRSFASYRGQSSLLSWIYGIAKNTLNNSLRRSTTESKRLDALDPEIVRPSSSISNCGPEDQLSILGHGQDDDDAVFLEIPELVLELLPGRFAHQQVTAERRPA